MLKFLIAYLLIYSGLHAAFYHRFRIILPQGRLITVIFVLFLALMVLSPMISRGLEVQGHDPAARIAAYAGYFWMGFLFLAFAGSLVYYLIDLVSWAAGRLASVPTPRPEGRAPAAGLLLACLGMVIYGWLNAKNIVVENVTIHTEKLPPHVEQLRVVQISDVHLGIINRDRVLKDIMNKVKSTAPDILVCTGDLVDGSMQNLMHLADIIGRVTPPYGKFAVTGNHEYYAGLDHALEFMRQGGFAVLRQEAVTAGGIINIAGVDDGGRFGKTDDGKVLHQVKNGLFVLFLKHRPDVPESSLGMFDLQLSGHTHNGQIFPFNFLVGLEFPHTNGLYNLGKGSALYVSRGTGTWGPPMRIGSAAEVTVIDIRGRRSED